MHIYQKLSTRLWSLHKLRKKILPHPLFIPSQGGEYVLFEAILLKYARSCDLIVNSHNDSFDSSKNSFMEVQSSIKS